MAPGAGQTPGRFEAWQPPVPANSWHTMSLTSAHLAGDVNPPPASGTRGARLCALTTGSRLNRSCPWRHQSPAFSVVGVQFAALLPLALFRGRSQGRTEEAGIGRCGTSAHLAIIRSPIPLPFSERVANPATSDSQSTHVTRRIGCVSPSSRPHETHPSCTIPATSVQNLRCGSNDATPRVDRRRTAPSGAFWTFQATPPAT